MLPAGMDARFEKDLERKRLSLTAVVGLIGESAAGGLLRDPRCATDFALIRRQSFAPVSPWR